MTRANPIAGLAIAGALLWSFGAERAIAAQGVSGFMAPGTAGIAPPPGCTPDLDLKLISGQSCLGQIAFASSSSVPNQTFTPGSLSGTGATFVYAETSTGLLGYTSGAQRCGPLGCTFDGAEQNLVLHAQSGLTTGGTYWGCFHATLTNNTATAPDSTATAATFALTASDGSCSNSPGGGVAQTPSTTYSDSFYYAPGANGFIGIRAFDGTNNAGAGCVVATMACTVNIQTYSGVTALMTAVPGTSYVRPCITYTTPDTTGLSTKLGVFPAQGEGSGGGAVWGFQHQVGSTCGAYLPTTTAAVSFSGDVFTQPFTVKTPQTCVVYFYNGQQAYTPCTSPMTLTAAGSPWAGLPVSEVLAQGAPPVPLAAQAAGFNTNTFSTLAFTTANVDTANSYATGFQWYSMNFFGISPTNQSIVLSAGVASVTGAQAASYGYTTAGSTGGSGWVGTAFGGGGYFEASVSFNDAVVDQTKGWPAWWSMSLEHLANLAAQQWPGQTAGYTHYIEPDFLEYIYTNQANQVENASLHDWYGTGTCVPSPPSNCSYSLNARWTAKPASGYTNFHRYGLLWIPATVSTQGSFTYFLDGIQIGSPQTYSQYVGASVVPPPSASTPWAFGVIDVNHIVLFLSAGTNTPLNAQSVQVWQASSAGNVHQ